ncbi:MAG: hypothetical protein IJX30_07950 [Clostridia bacterium]|nr:hypothetical protein [Clostridia bacterium]
MKRIKHTALASVILATIAFGTACAPQSQGEVFSKDIIPDYSGYTDQFDFYGYHSVHNGYYYVDDSEFYVGESFLNTEQYQLYKDAGMTIVYPQSILKIRGEEGAGDGDAEAKAQFLADRAADWEKIKPEIDKFVSVGLNKTTLYDEDLSWLGLNNYSGDPLVGEGMRFATEDELDAYVYELVSLYAEYPGVYGVCFADEPKYLAVQSYGEVYKSIQRVNKKYGFNLYPDYNLNPLNLTKLVYDEYYPHVEGTSEVDPNSTSNKASFEDGMKRYQAYIDGFVESMQPTAIQYDDYPLRHSGLSETYIPCLQYVAGVARDKNIDFHMVTQSFEMYSEGTRSMRKLTEPGAKWLNNMLLGFGVKEISYFTYYTRTENKTDGESFPDNGSFVNLYGKPTNIYYMMKEIIADNQAFAPTVLQFEYVKSGVFTKMPLNFSAGHIRYVEQNNATYSEVKSVAVDKECAMINELYDKENNRYMYMAMNIIDPNQMGSRAYQTITLEFDSKYNFALVYKDGEKSLYRLNNGKLEVKGAPGDASFVIPF